jgi:hypothetical protein
MPHLIGATMRKVSTVKEQASTLASRAMCGESIPARFVSRLDGSFPLAVVRGQKASAVQQLTLLADVSFDEIG